MALPPSWNHGIIWSPNDRRFIQFAVWRVNHCPCLFVQQTVDFVLVISTWRPRPVLCLFLLFRRKGPDGKVLNVFLFSPGDENNFPLTVYTALISKLFPHLPLSCPLQIESFSTQSTPFVQSKQVPLRSKFSLPSGRNVGGDGSVPRGYFSPYSALSINRTSSSLNSLSVRLRPGTTTAFVPKTHTLAQYLH